MTSVATMPPSLDLCCVVNDSPAPTVFLMRDISSNSDIDKFKEVIWKEKRVLFDDNVRDASQLALWRITIPTGKDVLDKVIKAIDFDIKQAMMGSELVTEYFKHGAPEKTVHVIVEPPKDSNFQELDLISGPSKTKLPVTDTKDHYVRQAYRDLYDEFGEKFEITDDECMKRLVVTGTLGIGKSVFLVYFTIRILITSREDEPATVIFQEKGGSKCYAFGGLSTVRHG
ncbi:hypothetical protein BGX27_004682 [Mortierella sp. AM989]|nr:hypothetical protein BGX27_004682 [Mortierella sp. AM989]